MRKIQIQSLMNDDNPKALTFGGERHTMPLADISHLSDYQKDELWRKAASAFGTYDYAVFESDEEFELALACYINEEHDRELKDDPEIASEHHIDDMEYALFQRGFYYHKKKNRVWKKEVLDPMVKEMADYALHSPQYDAVYLLGLEQKKMECMDAYFTHSVIADGNGDYSGCRWLRLCIKLLDYLTDDSKIPEDIILAINVRNAGFPISKRNINKFVLPDNASDKLYYGRKIYWHKAHKLYYSIRAYALHTWWD